MVAAFVVIACSETPKNSVPADIPSAAPAAPPSDAPKGPVGRIRGTVRLKGSPPAPAFEAITENQNVCGDKVSVARLALGKDNTVQRAFVYLEGVASVGEMRPRESVLIDQKDCQYVPHALTLSSGTKLEVTNSDPILHNVHAKESTREDGLRTLFNIAQPVRGQRTLIDPALIKPGIITLTCEAGHPWMSAYLFVADHPFVGVTGDSGEFQIADVPPGKYTIKMWHEGVTLKRNLKTLQRFEYEDPYEVSQEVVVEADKETIMNFDLVLRPNKGT